MQAIASAAVIALAAAAGGCAREAAESSDAAPALRVCADPNNLPFSNARGEGFENRLADVLAREMGATLAYVWWPQRRGFVRSTLNAGMCDVIMGVPAGFDPVLTTRPYYRSMYVVVSARDRALDVHALDDPALRTLRIGVHLIGDDGANTPPAHALASHGAIGNLVGFTIYGDYAEPNPPARIIDAVADGTVDLAMVWGPFAGYFGPRARVPLAIAPLDPDPASPELPFEYDIALGVRRDDLALRDALQAILDREAAEVDEILRAYGVPRSPLPDSVTAASLGPDEDR